MEKEISELMKNISHNDKMTIIYTIEIHILKQKQAGMIISEEIINNILEEVKNEC